MISIIACILNQYNTFGFTGSRNEHSDAARLAADMCYLLPRQKLNNMSIAVGCADGVDASVRAAFPFALVFRAKSYKANSAAGQLVMRSVDIVKYVRANKGVFLGFPDKPCPKSLKPSPAHNVCFSGSGSGTWASLCYAVGLEIPTIIFLPPDTPPPIWAFDYGFYNLIDNVYFASNPKNSNSLFL